MTKHPKTADGELFVWNLPYWFVNGAGYIRSLNNLNIIGDVDDSGLCRAVWANGESPTFDMTRCFWRRAAAELFARSILHDPEVP